MQNTDLKTLASRRPSPVKLNAGTAGKRSSIIMQDLILNVYVEFGSKNQIGLFLWNKPKTGGGVFDRYLHNNVIYKDRLCLHFKVNLPVEVVIISSSEYFKLLGTDKFSNL